MCNTTFSKYNTYEKHLFPTPFYYFKVSFIYKSKMATSAIMENLYASTSRQADM